MAVGGLSERLAFILELDPSNAISGMRRVGTEADRSLGNVDDRLNRIGGRMQVAGAGAVAFAGVAGRALFSFAQASEEAEGAQRRLSNSIANAPALAGESADAFAELATEIQNKTAADGDAIVSGMALAGQLGVTGDELRNLTPLAVDLAQKMGIDMEAAFRAVGRAVEGNTGQLERMIGPMAEGETAMEALRRSVGGYAEAEGATFSGQLERLKNQLGDVAEGIGGGVVGAFNDMLGPVTSAAEAFTRLDAGTQETIGKFAAFGTAAIGIAGAASFTIGSIVKMVDNFALAREGVANFVGSGGLGRLATVAVPAVGALALFGAALQNQAQDAAEADARIDSLASSIRETGSVAEATTAAFERGELFEGLGMSASEMTTTMADLGLSLEQLQGAWEGDVDAAREWGAALDAALASSSMTREETDRFLVALSDLGIRIGAAKDEASAQAAVLGEVEGATEGATEATEENTGAIEENTRALEERTEAALSARDNELSLEEATLRTTEAIEAYNIALALGTERERIQASIDLERQFYAEAEAAGRSAYDQQVAAGNTAGAMSASVQAQIDTLNRLLGNIGPNSPLRSGILGHIAVLNAIPRDLETRIRTVNEIVNRGTIVRGGFGPSGVAAAGTEMLETGVTRVNERGVELYTDPTGAQYLLGGQGGAITPNHALTAVGGGSSSSFVFAPQIAVTAGMGANGAEIARVMLDALRTLVRQEGTGELRNLIGVT